MPRKRFPGSIDRRGDTFRVRLSVAGTMHSFTLETDDKRAAEQFARTKDKELRATQRRKASGLAVGVTFSALLATFREQAMPGVAEGTRNAYEDSLGPIETYFVTELGDPIIESIAAKHVTEFLTWRRVHRLDGDAPLSPRTLVRDRSVLHRLFSFADRLELRQGNPVARVDRPRVDRFEPVILSADQYNALVTTCGDDRPMLRTYVLTLGEAGLRCESEALHLRWRDIDLDAGFLWVASGHEHRTKTGRGRHVPLTSRLATALREHTLRFKAATYRGRTSEFVFHHEMTRRHHKAGERITSMRHAFANAAARAKLPDELRQHDLRHRRATTWLAEGKSPALVKEALGHASLATTMQYMHLVRDNLRALVETPQTAPQQPPQVGQLSGQR